MPNYLYKCAGCDDEQTHIYSIKEEIPRTLGTCSDCGGEIRRVFLAPSVRLRGGGWARHPERDVANRTRGAQPKGAAREERRITGE